MPACTLSRAPLSCSTGRTRRSVVLASAPSHTPSHLCERPLAELAAERWPSAAAAALCARSTRRPFHAALGHGAAAAHRCGKAAQGRTARACGTRHRGRRARRAAARGLCRECCLFCLTPSFPGIWMAVCLRQSAQGTLSRCAFHEPSAASWVVSLHAASVAKRRRRAARLPREPSEHEARVLLRDLPFRIEKLHAVALQHGRATSNVEFRLYAPQCVKPKRTLRCSFTHLDFTHHSRKSVFFK